MRGLIGLVGLLGAVTALWIASAVAADTGVAVVARNGSSPEMTVARRLFEQELGKPIADSTLRWPVPISIPHFSAELLVIGRKTRHRAEDMWGSFELIRILIALILAGSVAGPAIDFPVSTDSRPTPELMTARRLLEHELGRTVGNDDIAVAGLDLGFSSLPELLIIPRNGNACASAGCRWRLLELREEGYVDLFARLSLPAETGPGPIRVHTSRHGGHYNLVIGGKVLIYKDGGYVDAATLEPSKLAKLEFLKACGRSRSIHDWIEGGGQAPGMVMSSFCQCLAAGFEERQLPQKSLDLFMREALDKITEEESSDPEKQEALEEAYEVKESCAATAGWGDPIPPATDDYPAGTENLRVDRLMDACVSLRSEVSSDSLPTPGHAIGYCGCLAGRLLKENFGQAALDRLASAYRGEISDDDLHAEFPSLLDADDAASIGCIEHVIWAQ